jgi:hypothetical protein
VGALLSYYLCKDRRREAPAWLSYTASMLVINVSDENFVVTDYK